VERSLLPHIREDLDSKIVLVSGPRQVGKTTLARQVVPDRMQQDYLSFDAEDDRRMILDRAWARNVELVILDELHKMKSWKRWLKGIYDTEGVRPRLLVTGSARLDTYRRSGDSLAGRHFLYRLHPVSVREAGGDAEETIGTMLRVGGFPEPFLKGGDTFAARWRRTHLDRILREDLLDLESVRDLKSMEILVQLLSERVGSPVSYSSLARDLEVSPHTVKRWIGILEMLFVAFVVPPYAKRLAKAIRKEPKIYLFDVGRVRAGDAARLENLVACHLLKALQFREDTLGESTRLCYVRDKEQREVDFATVIDERLDALIEVKTSDATVSPHLRYFTERLRPTRAVQIVRHLDRERHQEPIRTLRLSGFLTQLDA
jgi:predicted AAA+ superfamily ATPase